MANKLQTRRLLMLALLLAIAFAGLGYRLVDLQVLRHEDLRTEARKNTERGYQLPAEAAPDWTGGYPRAASPFGRPLAREARAARPGTRSPPAGKGRRGS